MLQKGKRLTKSDLKQVQTLLITDKPLTEIAGLLNTTVHYLNSFLADNPELYEIRKASAEQHIIEALYKKAIGYSYTEKAAAQIRIGKRVVNVKDVTKEKHCPPDVSAAMLLLKKLNPERWNDKI